MEHTMDDVEGIHTTQRFSFAVGVGKDAVVKEVEVRLPLSLITDLALRQLAVIFQHHFRKGTDEYGKLKVGTHTVEYKEL